VARTVAIDPWMLRHLVLSIDDRPRSPRDRASLEEVIRRTASALAEVPAPAPFGPPRGTEVGAAIVRGVPLWLFETNAWILAPDGAGGDCVVVDAPPDVGPLLRQVEHDRLRVRAVFLTHGHLDHAGGVGTLVAGLPEPVPVYVHERDRAQVAAPLGVDRLVARALGIAPPATDLLHPLVDGDRIVVAGVDVLARHTPGHTPGTTCFLVTRTARPLVFSGDQLFATGSGRCDLAGGSATLRDASMQVHLWTLPDDVVVLPGHGEATTIGDAREVAPIAAVRGGAV
jgi:hydroxyacylglutathione hydrolase